MSKKDIINKIIEIEGGYVNDPSDSGGETNFGITKQVARDYGYQGEMKDLPRELAFEIYSKKYWDSLNLDGVNIISSVIADELADTGINMGTKRAAIFLQRSLNVLNNGGKTYYDVVVDGDIGQKTLNALASYVNLRKAEGVKVLLKMLNSLQGNFYIELVERREKDEKFIYGWFVHRV